MPEKEYISREAGFNAILKLVPKVDDDGYCWVIRGDAATAIDSIPAADVRPVVRGKWRERRFLEDVYGAECSVCHTAWDAPTNYCPNCGARMKKR